MTKIKKYVDSENKFQEAFVNDTFYIRTGIIENGEDTGIDPFMRNFPALLDIGVMGKCSTVSTCSVGCYQQSKNNMAGYNMSLDFFQDIIDQIKGKTFQIALGGFGNPNQHENFEEIVKYSCENNVIVTYTTSGLGLTAEQVEITKKYCGAVAVSWHNKPYTFEAIDAFLKAGITTNVHYVLGNDSIDDAIVRLENNDFPSGIQTVVFLLYKPVGKVKKDNVLKPTDPRVENFYKLVDKKHPFMIGLDACHAPGVANFSNNIMKESVSACDAARFSMYITPDGFALPCSFDTTTRKWAVDLMTHTVRTAWKSNTFEQFRKHHKKSCLSCKTREDCLGGCPLMKEINLCCNRKDCNYYEN